MQQVLHSWFSFHWCPICIYLASNIFSLFWPEYQSIISTQNTISCIFYIFNMSKIVLLKPFPYSREIDKLIPGNRESIIPGIRALAVTNCEYIELSHTCRCFMEEKGQEQTWRLHLREGGQKLLLHRGQTCVHLLRLQDRPVWALQRRSHDGSQVCSDQSSRVKLSFAIKMFMDGYAFILMLQIHLANHLKQQQTFQQTMKLCNTWRLIYDMWSKLYKYEIFTHWCNEIPF